MVYHLSIHPSIHVTIDHLSPYHIFNLPIIYFSIYHPSTHLSIYPSFSQELDNNSIEATDQDAAWHVTLPQPCL